MLFSLREQYLFNVLMMLLGILFGYYFKVLIIKSERKKIHKKLIEIIEAVSKIPPSKDDPNAKRIRSELLRVGLNSDFIMHNAGIQRITFLKFIKLLLKTEVPPFKKENTLINQELAKRLKVTEKDIELFEFGQATINDHNRNVLLDYYDWIIKEHKIDIAKYQFDELNSSK